MSESAYPDRASLKTFVANRLRGLEGAVVVELGASDGRSTRWILDHLEAKTYLAVEPDPRNLKLLRGQSWPSCVEIVPVAVGKEDGTATLHLSSSDRRYGPNPFWGFSSTLRRPTKHLEVYPFVRYDEDAEVAVRSLDSLTAERGIDRVDFLWCDIEGSERDMIEGGAKTLSRTSLLFIEKHHQELYEGMWLRDQLLEHLQGWKVVGEWAGDMMLVNERLAP